MKPLRPKPKKQPRQEFQQVVEPVEGVAPSPGTALLPGIIFLLTLAPFLPVLQNGFVNWDDDRTLVENSYYRGLGWTQLRWMFGTYYMGHYQPLSWLSFGLDYLLWGMEPFGYHLTSLLLHGVNAVLLYFVTLSLFDLSATRMNRGGDFRIAAAVAALIFSLHPLRVESVAWATERRDVLSGCFILASVACYLRGLRVAPGDRRWFGSAVILYMVSLLAKATGITLPIVLLVLDVYPLRRLAGAPNEWFRARFRDVWLEKAPFFILAVAAGIVALIAQYHAEAVKTLAEHSLVSRLIQVLYGLVFYLWKTVVPGGLSPLYELPKQAHVWTSNLLWAGLGSIVISLFFIIVWRRWPAGLTAWLCYGIILAPILGLAQSGVQLVADRYSYLSCLSWAVLLAAAVVGFFDLWQTGRLHRWIFVAGNGALAAVLLGIGLLTWKQTQIWRDSETLWRHVLAIEPNSSVAYLNLGQELIRHGRAGEAMEYFQRALRINPDSTVAHLNLGRLLALLGKPEEAVQHFQRVLSSNPRFAEGHNDLANAWLRQKRLAEAIDHYRIALQIDPGYEIASNNLGSALVQGNMIPEAIKQFEYSLQINPASADTHYNLAKVFARNGDLSSAIQHYQAALKFNPGDAEAHNELGALLAQQGSIHEAMAHFRAAATAKPDSVDAFVNLGRGEAAQGNLKEAADHFRHALQMDPEFAPAHENLARVFVLQGDKTEAAKHFREALRILRSQSDDKAER